jgi:glycerol-3-phosphate dehydrogenase
LLDGNSFNTASDLNNYLDKLKEQFSQLGFEPELASIFVKRYGDKMDMIIELLDNDIEENDKMDILLKAEIKYGISHEMIFFPTDFIQRQTGMLWFDRQRCLLKKDLILEAFAFEFVWDEKKISLERMKLDQLLDSVLDFND